MSTQLWSWILTAIGLAGFFLAGRKVWWCWYINIANQVVWLAYSLITHQYGFLVGTVAYTIVFAKNAAVWTRAHRDAKTTPRQVIGHISKIEMTDAGMFVQGKLNDPYTKDDF